MTSYKVNRESAVSNRESVVSNRESVVSNRESVYNGESVPNGLWQKPPISGARRSSVSPKQSLKDDSSIQFFKEDRTGNAIYNIYLKKVQYNVDPDMCLDAEDEMKAHLQWRLEEVRILKCGTLGEIVAALASETGELESTNVSIFLSTYRTFASTKDVLDEMLKRYTTIGELPLQQQIRDAHRRTLKTILSVWMDSYSDDFYDPPYYAALRSLKEFTLQHVPDSGLRQKTEEKLCSFLNKDDTSSSRSLFDIRSSFLLSSRPSQDLNANYFVQPLDINAVSSGSFAEQLTFLDAELFKKVVPHHCLGSIWSRRCQKFTGSHQQCPSVHATIEQFNTVTYRVIATIVKRPTLSAYERSSIVQKWIDIAQECRILKNFSSLKAIISGLQSAPVYRLHSVWILVNRSKMLLFDELSAIFSEENNQKSCRELLNKEGTAKCADPSFLTSGKSPRKFLGLSGVMLKHRKMQLADATNASKMQGTVPYLGTFLTDLMMLDTAFKDTTENGLINFEKRRKEFEIMTQIRLFQSAAGQYRIKPDQHFMTWFYQIRVYDDNESYELSREIEPEPNVPLVKRHQKKSSLGYFTFRRLSSTSSMEDVLNSGVVSAAFSSHHCRRGSSDTQSILSSASTTSSPVCGPKLSHSASLGSLHSFDNNELSLPPPPPPLSSSSSSPFRSEDSIVVKVYLASSDSHSTNHYKSIRLNNSDHMKIFLKNIFLKYNLTSVDPLDYSVFQILLDDSELLLPEKGNVFYAINTSVVEIKCIVRKKSELCEAVEKSWQKPPRRKKLLL